MNLLLRYPNVVNVDEPVLMYHVGILINNTC